MSDAALIRCEWTGEAFAPFGGAMLRRARDAFGDGEVVLLNVQNERSMASHKHYFAALYDYWVNLPESVALMPYAATSEHLRKHALIRTGWHDVQTVDAGSKAAAHRVAAMLAAVHREYCVVSVEGPVVRCFTARSQSMRAMGKADFQRSKDDVLGWCDALVKGEAA